jgi:hypothetical protein
MKIKIVYNLIGGKGASKVGFFMASFDLSCLTLISHVFKIINIKRLNYSADSLKTFFSFILVP